MKTKHECRFIAQMKDIDFNDPCGECRFIKTCKDAIVVDQTPLSLCAIAGSRPAEGMPLGAIGSNHHERL